jgi:hypothetical protein
MTAMPTTNAKGECLCVRCVDERYAGKPQSALDPFYMADFRYACDVCGNKRCPHHKWHGFKCTGSNEPGQTEDLIG